jgi:hypothetical protein
MASGGCGETLIGLTLARQLREYGVESQFVIESRSEMLFADGGFRATTLEPKMGALAMLLVDEVVRNFRPDCIILADYLTYCGAFKTRYGMERWFIDRYELPILPIDIWEWDSTELEVDMFVGQRMVIDSRIRELPAHLRPVPLCHPDANGVGMPFCLAEGDERVSLRTRRHLRTSLGLGDGEVLVMLAHARWQLPTGVDKPGHALARAVPELLVHYLRQLPDTVHFVIVGERIPELASLPQDRCHVLPPCRPSRFNVLVGSVDLLLTLNIGATTLARATLAGVPGLVLVNSASVSSAVELHEHLDRLGATSPWLRAWAERSLPFYPFRMWPLGFHEFLEPVLTSNPYLETFKRAELLDEATVLATLNALLFDREVRDRLAAEREAYVNLLAQLPDSHDVVERALETTMTMMRQP